jgi:hypothetical protein
MVLVVVGCGGKQVAVAGVDAGGASGAGGVGGSSVDGSTVAEAGPDAVRDGAPTLAGTTQVLSVDEQCSRSSATLPLQGPLPDTAYAPVPSVPTYSITFSSDSADVTLTPLSSGYPKLAGSIAAPTGARTTYDLDAFGGGKLWIWDAGDHTRAELVLYGSGVPILICDRGVLGRYGELADGGECFGPLPGADGVPPADCPCLSDPGPLGVCTSIGTECWYVTCAICSCLAADGGGGWSCLYLGLRC